MKMLLLGESHTRRTVNIYTSSDLPMTNPIQNEMSIS